MDEATISGLAFGVRPKREVDEVDLKKILPKQNEKIIMHTLFRNTEKI